jgi:hypothetical protein
MVYLLLFGDENNLEILDVHPLKFNVVHSGLDWF